MSTAERRPPRRRGPRDPEAPAAPEPEVVAPQPVSRPVAEVAPPPTPREATDFDALRAIAEMDRASVTALMDQFTSQAAPSFKVGQRVRGRITNLGSQGAFIDLGGKHDATIDRIELSGDVAVGDWLDAFVASTGGELRLTRTPSGSAAREMMQESMAAKLPVDGKITAVSDAGWQVSLADGMRAFCPASHTGASEPADPELVGRSLPFLVHDLRGRDVVLSRRAITEQETRAAEGEKYADLREGDMLSGTVSSLREFGAFVKLPNGLEGMVHISNLADRRVKHPSEVVKEGDVVQVRVLSIDRARRRVELGMKPSAVSGGNAGPSASELSAGNGAFGLFAALLKDVKVKDPKSKRK